MEWEVGILEIATSEALSSLSHVRITHSLHRWANNNGYCYHDFTSRHLLSLSHLSTPTPTPVTDPANRKRISLGVRQTWPQTWPLPLTHCVTSNRLLPL